MLRMEQRAEKFFTELKSKDPKLADTLTKEVDRLESADIRLAFHVAAIKGGPNPDWQTKATLLTLIHVLKSRNDAEWVTLRALLEESENIGDVLRDIQGPCNCPACTEERKTKSVMN